MGDEPTIKLTVPPAVAKKPDRGTQGGHYTALALWPAACMPSSVVAEAKEPLGARKGSKEWNERRPRRKGRLVRPLGALVGVPKRKSGPR
jgi:hypothetical protein